MNLDYEKLIAEATAPITHKEVIEHIRDVARWQLSLLLENKRNKPFIDSSKLEPFGKWQLALQRRRIRLYIKTIRLLSSFGR